MTINFYDAGNSDGLFDVQGKAFHAQNTIRTAVGTTIPAEVDDVLEIFENLATDFELSETIAQVPSAATALQDSATSPISTLSQFAADLLVKMVNDDNPQPDDSLETALTELIRQMIANSESVDASTVAASVTANGSNTGDGVIITSTKRGDGLVQENILAEDVEVQATSNGLTASLRFTGEESATVDSADWPKGSGVSRSISAVAASSSLLANGDMEDEDDITNVPDDWIASVATIGTTLKMTDVEIQTIALAGSHTGGYWQIHWTSPDGDAVTTAPIAHDAAASTVQAALRLFPGLGAVTVAATGTSPNLTHTVTFTGQGGNVAQFTSTDARTGGSGGITHGTSSAGTAQVFAGGKAVEFDSNGSELTTLNQRLTTLQPETAYAVSLWAIADVVPAAGVVTVDLVDGIGGTVITDAQGANNAFTFNAADLTTSWQHLSDLVSGETVFRTPSVVPDVVYLRVRISTAISTGTSMFIDHVAMTPMTELYAGGPMVAVFSGSVPFKTADTWTLTTTNNRAGEIQEAYNRNFNMAQLGLLLPSDTGGSETVPDSVIS